VLGAAFVEHGVTREALRTFESALLAPRSALVPGNRALGPGSILGVVDDRCADAFDNPDDLSRADWQRFTADWRATSDAAIERLNTSPPTIPTG
jgi:hypothetical protein